MPIFIATEYFSEPMTGDARPTGVVEEYLADDVYKATEMCRYTHALKDGRAVIGPARVSVWPQGLAGPTFFHVTLKR